MLDQPAEPGPRETLIRTFAADRALAHRVIFAHRHKSATPPFHREILSLWADPAAKRTIVLAFRGAAKSTLAEENISLKACFQEFRYGLIVGNTYERACERLSSIKREFETNEHLQALFGDLVGATWAHDQIILSNGIKIQAFGARQSLRGAKHYDARPDYVLVDDLEDEDSVATEPARQKLKAWWTGNLLPALDPEGRLDMLATPLHPEALAERTRRSEGFASLVFPIEHLNLATGELTATWPERFPLDGVERLRSNFEEMGSAIEFTQEYLCRSEDIASKPFKAEHIRIQQPPAWLPKFMMVDPARTTNQKSARTGYAVWGWTANRLHVVEAHGGFHKPDEIIDEIFRLHALHDPIHVGVELVGLEEWMAQPLRHAMVQRGVALPLLPLRAPKDKNGFIGSLQPFYQAGEVTHAAALPDLVSELLAFPTGRKDVPNALAYALRMRAGRPVYEDFRPDHVRAIEPAARTPCWLLVNARPARTSGVLVQAIDGVLRVFADWVREGPPQETFSDLARDAALTAAAPLRIYAGSEHFDAHANVGLVQAARRGASLVQRGGPSEAASGSLAEYLRETRRGEPRMLVSPDARWTLKALSGGYARGLDKAGVVQDHPAENDYRMAMEPLEGFVRWFSALASTEESRQDVRYATTNDGRRYLSARR